MADSDFKEQGEHVMGFFKQKGHSKRFLRSIAICCGFMGIEASKPSGYPDGESMRWNVVLFRSIFAIVFVGIVSDYLLITNHFVAWKAIHGNVNQTTFQELQKFALCENQKLLLSQSWQVVF